MGRHCVMINDLLSLVALCVYQESAAAVCTVGNPELCNISRGGCIYIYIYIYILQLNVIRFVQVAYINVYAYYISLTVNFN